MQAAISPRRARGRALTVLFAAFVATLTLMFGGTAHAAGAKSGGCTGTNSSLGTDYVFTGSGYQAGASFLVTIAVPNGSSFTTVATADRSGNWGEYWYGTVAGTYTATVTPVHGGNVLGSCSLVVS
jgi:hypothetical protein